MEEDRKPADNDALAHIHDLVAEEKTLREQLQHGDISASEEHERLRRATAHKRILLCGSGARRGGAVSGIGGHNAAMAVLASV